MDVWLKQNMSCCSIDSLDFAKTAMAQKRSCIFTRKIERIKEQQDMFYCIAINDSFKLSFAQFSEVNTWTECSIGICIGVR